MSEPRKVEWGDVFDFRPRRAHGLAVRVKVVGFDYDPTGSRAGSLATVEALSGADKGKVAQIPIANLNPACGYYRVATPSEGSEGGEGNE